MSIDHRPNQTGLSQPGGDTRRRWLLGVLGVLVAVLVAAGVAFAATRDSGVDLEAFDPPAASSAPSGGDPAPTAVPPAQSAIEAEGPAILGQFARFWTPSLSSPPFLRPSGRRCGGRSRRAPASSAH